MRRPLAYSALAFLTLTILVALGAFTPADQFAVDHLMPGLRAFGRRRQLLQGTIPLFRIGPRDSLLQQIADFVVLPAAALPSALVLGVLGALLVRRSREVAAAFVASAYLGALALDGIWKTLVRRPALDVRVDGTAHHIRAFYSSFPSGHATRAVILVVAARLVWPAASLVAVPWLVGTLILLEVAGFHTPSDIVGGAIVGGAFAEVIRCGANLRREDVRRSFVSWRAAMRRPRANHFDVS